MMTGEIGTSETKTKYRYYKCNHAKKHTCNKKAVKKDLIEKLVIDELQSLISDDKIIDDLSEIVYQFQLEENNTVLILQNKLAEVEKKLKNLVEAIAQGIFSPATKGLLDELEEQKAYLESELFKAQIKRPIFTKEQIQFALLNYRKLDLSTKEGKQKLIDGFVNSIFLYDNHFVITLNYKNNSRTVTFDEINSSPLTSKGLPKEKAYPNGYAFSFVRGERTTAEFGFATVAKRRCFSVANGYPT